MVGDYKHIPCSLYDALEAAALRGAHVALRTTEEEGQERIIRVVDLVSRDKQEFLVARDAETDEELLVRLDAVVSVTNISTHITYSGHAC